MNAYSIYNAKNGHFYIEAHISTRSNVPCIQISTYSACLICCPCTYLTVDPTISSVSRSDDNTLVNDAMSPRRSEVLLGLRCRPTASERDPLASRSSRRLSPGAVLPWSSPLFTPLAPAPGVPLGSRGRADAAAASPSEPDNPYRGVIYPVRQGLLPGV